MAETAWAMAACLLADICRSGLGVLMGSFGLAARFIARITCKEVEYERREIDEREQCEYDLYEGKVWHERRHPVRHQFDYNVRYAVINLDNVPSWFVRSAGNHLSAEQARTIVGSSGPVYLLTIPASAGYEQNPISVYYCYNDQGRPKGSVVSLICEVTNTPWAERVTFVVQPNETVAKLLHVSPFMDMLGTWKFRASAPGEKLSLSIVVEHPEHGNYFIASLQADRVKLVQRPESFLWLMPHKVAIWIYWQALVLLWKGVGFVQHPKYLDGNEYRRRGLCRDAELKHSQTRKGAKQQPTTCKREGLVAEESDNLLEFEPEQSRRFCTWREAPSWPWL